MFIDLVKNRCEVALCICHVRSDNGVYVPIQIWRSDTESVHDGFIVSFSWGCDVGLLRSGSKYTRLLLLL